MLPDSALRMLLHVPGVRGMWNRSLIGSLQKRVRFGIAKRPHYSYGVYQAAQLAKRLGLPAITVIEFGVAGGNGLVALEEISEEIGRFFGIRIDVVGFDSGEGMPKPLDYRDLPHIWGSGFYKMDQAALKARLKRAKLMIGDVSETVSRFPEENFAPIGFISFDLDYYSSTKNAFRIFDLPSSSRLPRVWCYFDDIVGETACHNEYIGELCAIREFNEEHSKKKISPNHMLRYTQASAHWWHELIYIMHDFEHPLYCVNIASENERPSQLPLNAVT